MPAPKPGMHRYMVSGPSPRRARRLDAEGKKQVNKTNASEKVRWVYSYANADKTKTFCIYEGPDEKSIRQAASANKIPVELLVEIPVVLSRASRPPTRRPKGGLAARGPVAAPAQPPGAPCVFT